MRVITKSWLIADVANQWKNQYFTRGRGWLTYRGEARVTWQRLKELPPTATEDDVAAIIGNRSWTRSECDECGEDVQILVQLGEEPNWESATAEICVSCLRKALAQVDATVTSSMQKEGLCLIVEQDWTNGDFV